VQVHCEILVQGGDASAGLDWLCAAHDAERRFAGGTGRDTVSITLEQVRVPGETNRKIGQGPAALRFGPGKACWVDDIRTDSEVFRLGESPPSHAATLRALQFR